MLLSLSFFSVRLTCSFYLSSPNSSYSYFIFLILINPKSASWFSITEAGKILLCDHVAFSSVFVVLYWLFFVNFTCLHSIKSQMKPLPYNTYSLFSRFLPFSESFILISFLTVHMREFSEYTVCGTIQKKQVSSSLCMYKTRRILYS